MEGSTGTQSASASKRRSCLGVTYYNAWLRTHGAPVCVGFSKQQENGPVQSQAVFESHVGTPPNFKYWCVGHSMHGDGGGNSMPYCEGLEVLMNQALKQHATSGGPASGGSSSSTSPVVTSLAAPPAISSAQAVAMQSHAVPGSSTQQAAQAQQQPDPHHPASGAEQQQDEVPAGPSMAKLYSTAVRNMELVRAGLRNEGPIALRPVPASWQELGDRFWNTAARNGNSISTGAQRVARNMYASTVKPMAAILGLNRKS